MNKFSKLTKYQKLLVLAHFCNDYHSGQWSKGYRYLCLSLKSLRNMGVDYPLNIKLGKNLIDFYQYLEVNYSDKM